MSDERDLERRVRELRDLLKRGRPDDDFETIIRNLDEITEHLTDINRTRKVRQDSIVVSLHHGTRLHDRLLWPARANPPIGARLLLDLLLSKDDRNAIPGDLEEEFGTKLAKYGPNGARLWFWCEAVRTIATRNPICRWLLVGGLVRIGEWIFRKIGS
jgi:hypothetical protein